VATMRVTVRVEIELSDGSTSIVERSITPTAFGDNPAFFASVAEQASLVARTRVGEAIEAMHGKAPSPAHVTIPAGS
jgi:hypothetical protein